MLIHRGIKTIFPSDLCYKCGECTDCDIINQLIELITSFNDEVQFNVSECRRYSFADLEDEKEDMNFQEEDIVVDKEEYYAEGC